MNVLIVGGCGSLGNFYAKLLKKNNFEIYITDILDESLIREKCKLEGFNFFEGNYSQINIIIISVPNNIAISVLKEISKKAKKETLIFDFCSVKSFIVPELEKLKGKDFELASIHPMHGPRVSSIAGYPIIIIPIETGKKFEEIINFFETENTNIIETNAEIHDKTLSIVQGLTHFSQFVSAKTIHDLKINLKESKEFSSPNFDLFMSLMSRVILQNPEIYAQIQTENPYNEKMRKAFSANSVELEKISKAGTKELQKEIISSASIFNSLNDVLFESDKAISALKFISKTLEDNIGNKFLIENVSNNTFHYGIIEKIEKNKVWLKEGKRELCLNLSKIRLTTKKEMFEYRRNNILEKYLDFSFLVDNKCKKEAIVKAFSKIKHSKIEIVDEFKSNKFNDKKSLTLRIHFFSDDDIEIIKKEVFELINGLGFENR